MDIKQVQQHWVGIFPKMLVEQLLETYSEVKSNFYLGKLRPNEVEGGRFSEAVFRLLEFIWTKKYTSLSKKIDTDKLILGLANTPSGILPDSIRLHIPRTLRLIYDIRNNRDAAHLADGIDPNLQDATLVCANCDWIMAELIRLYHGISANEAHKIVENLVTRKAPVVQEFGHTLKTLNPSLGVSDRALLLLYHCGASGVSSKQLSDWVKPSQKKNLGRCLNDLEHEKDLIILHENTYKITRLGQQEVESRRLLH
jgi:hypothetical protein